MKLVEKIENNYPILIHSADCILDKDVNLNLNNYDVAVVTKEKYRRALFKYKNYGWVNKRKDKIINFSIKKQPLSDESTVITGIFLFRNLEIYKNLFEKTKKRMSNKDIEIHIDYLIETAIIENMKVKEIKTKKSVMIGTPIEYELFKYMDYVKKYLSKKL